jgi:outer membrane protein assembly factor BamB
MALAVDPADSTWSVFRGNPLQTGVARSKLTEKIEILWSVSTGDSIESAVAVANGTVFAASMDEHVYAIDLKTAKVKWKFKAPPITTVDKTTGIQKVIQKSAPFKAPPSVRDGTVYVGDLDGNFYCIDAEKGTKKWSYETGAEVGGANFHAQSILFTSHDEHLYCLTMDGKLRWKFKTEGPIYGAPTVAEGKTFLVGCDSQMHVIDVQTGKEDSAVDLGGQTGATAAVAAEMLYIGTMKNEVKAIRWKKGTIAWTYKSARNANAFYSSPAVTDKQVLIGSRDNRLHCIDRMTGNSKWSFPTGNKVDSSPVVAGSRVIVGSHDRHLYVLDLESGKELQKIPLDGAINASPAVVDGKVLIGTQKGTLYCLGTKK